MLRAAAQPAWTLVWVEVDAADGYDVRYDVRIIETARIDCEAPPDEEEMVRGSPYTFTASAHQPRISSVSAPRSAATRMRAQIGLRFQGPHSSAAAAAAAAATAADGVECLSSTGPGNMVAVDNDCVTIRASRMLIDLHGEGHDEICGI